MRVDEAGHIVMPDGKTTAPLNPVRWYVGTAYNFIGFDYMLLPDFRVVLHSALSLLYDDLIEDFLYEVVERAEALDAAHTMLWDAHEYLEEQGHLMDGNYSPQEFYSKLRQELATGLH